MSRAFLGLIREFKIYDETRKTVDILNVAYKKCKFKFVGIFFVIIFSLCNF